MLALNITCKSKLTEWKFHIKNRLPINGGKRKLSEKRKYCEKLPESVHEKFSKKESWLEIPHLKLTHTGEYYCSGVAPSGRVFVARSRVIVECKKCQFYMLIHNILYHSL